MTDEQIDKIMVNLAMRRGFINGYRHAAHVIKKHFKKKRGKTKEILSNIAVEFIEYAAELEALLNADLERIEKEAAQEVVE